MYEVIRESFSIAKFSTMAEAVEHIKFLPAGRYIIRHWIANGEDFLVAPRLGKYAINKQ